MSDNPANQPAPAAPSEASPVTAPPCELPPHRATLRDWLELARISNLPTVWTNVMVGCATIVPSTKLSSSWSDKLSFSALVLIAAASISMFYAAGMILNDIIDIETDRRERPNRPLPSGRISRKDAFRAVLCLFSAGTVFHALAGNASSYALVLIMTIVAYDLLHKRFASSVLLMGACRGMVYLTAAAIGSFPLQQGGPIWPLAGGIALYTICITIVSRAEVSNTLDLRKWLAVLMPVGVLAMVGVLKPAKMEWWIAVAAFAVSLWLARAVKFVFAKPPKTVPAILTWLSGMCLIDAYFLTLLGYPFAALFAGACFALTAWGHRKILGT